MITFGFALIFLLLWLVKNRRARKPSSSAVESKVTPMGERMSSATMGDMGSGDEDSGCSFSVGPGIEKCVFAASIKPVGVRSGFEVPPEIGLEKLLDIDLTSPEAESHSATPSGMSETTYDCKKDWKDEDGEIWSLRSSERSFYQNKKYSSDDPIVCKPTIGKPSAIVDLTEGEALARGIFCGSEIRNKTKNHEEQQRAFPLSAETPAVVAAREGIKALNEVPYAPPIQMNFGSSVLGDFAASMDAETVVMVYRQFQSTSRVSLIDFLRAFADVSYSSYERTGDLAQIDKSLSFISKAIDLFPSYGDGDMDTLAGLYQAEGLCFYTRSERLGVASDIECAIRSWTRASDFTDDSHADKPSRLNNLGCLLHMRFNLLGELADISNAISVQQQAVGLTSDYHNDKPSMLNSLGNSLSARFRRLGELADIHNAISTLQHSIDLTPEGHADRPSWLNNLGNSLFTRFECLGELADIDNAIGVQQQAVALTPENHANRPSLLNNLGASLWTRFRRVGELADIDNAITMQRQAAAITPEHHINKPTWLNNLGNSLFTRFERLEELVDINNAIKVQRQAVDLTPAGHPDKPPRLNNLGTSLGTRFRRVGELADINDAISTIRQAINLTPEDHANKPSWLSNLGTSLLTRFKSVGDLADIDNAISVQRQAVDLTSDGHADKPGLLNNLGNSLFTRFEHLEERADIDNAIGALQLAADLIPEGHADKPYHLNNLGRSLLSRSRCLRSPSDLRSAISFFNIAANSISGAALVRYQAACMHSTLLYPDLDPHRKVIDLIPRVVWLGRTVQQRYKDLEQLGDAVMEAVSAACIAKEYGLALEWLEQGRAIVWGQILHLRSPMDSLQAAHPELAEELNTVATKLEVAGTDDGRTTSSESSLEESAQFHRRLAEKWEALLVQVRALPDFTDFLLPKQISVLKTTSLHGTIVVINVSRHRSDALILQPGSSTIGHAHLANVTLDNLKAARRGFFRSLQTSGVRVRDAERMSVPGRTVTGDVLARILTMLWNDVAQPILDYLGYTSPSIGNLPHITWCLTGPLASLPLHAAGIYNGSRNESKLFNYIVSSYTPSLAALLETLDRTPSGTPRVLAVTQAATPNLSPLPGTIAEVDEVERQISHHKQLFMRMDGAHATVADVSEQMNHHNWVHFSCHGKQDAFEPTKSAFYLHDGALELAEIMKKPLKNAELAYLSACQTASGDAKLPDEAVHLAAGMFIAGYRSVVATLWSIKDDEAPLVARVFYDRLLSNPGGGVARALHDAVGELRRQVGDKDFISWVPYIHMGH